MIIYGEATNQIFDSVYTYAGGDLDPTDPSALCMIQKDNVNLIDRTNESALLLEDSFMTKDGDTTYWADDFEV